MNYRIQIWPNLYFSADVGGNAGLFLGTSLLTVLEMGEFIVITLLITLKYTSSGRMGHKSKISDGDISKSKNYRIKSFEMHQTNSSELDVNKNDGQKPN